MIFFEQNSLLVQQYFLGDVKLICVLKIKVKVKRKLEYSSNFIIVFFTSVLVRTYLNKLFYIYKSII